MEAAKPCSEVSHKESLPPKIDELDKAPAVARTRKRFTKQLSMLETRREVAWEMKRRLHRNRPNFGGREDELTDEDLRELKGSIELGFGFEEGEGQKLCNTLPALDLYFAVNRQISPVSSPAAPMSSSTRMKSSPGSPRSNTKLNLFSSGNDPQQVKAKLRHWAQAVACSVMQSH